MKNLQLALTSILLALVIALTIRLWPLVNESAQTASPASDQLALTAKIPASESIKKNLDSIQNSVTSEAAISDSIKADLDAIKDQLSKEENWPQSIAEVTQLHDKLATALNQLPPRTQEELLPSLVPVRWTIQALWILLNPPAEGTDSMSLSTYADELELLVSNRPMASPENLESRLIKRRNEVRELVVTNERVNVIKEAQVALGGKGDIDQAIRRINGYEDKEARSLLFQMTFKRDFQGISEDFQAQEKLVDPVLRDFAVTRLSQGILDLRLRASFSNEDVPKNLSDGLVAIEKKVNQQQETALKTRQNEYSKSRRDYQVWALNEIRKIPLLTALDTEEKAKIGPIDRRNPMSTAYQNADITAKKKLRDSMIEHMSSIDTTLLDEAVATWYRKVFQQRFDQLEGNDQFAVITGFSTKLKATLPSPAKR